MQLDTSSPAPADDPNDKRPWYKLMNRYHWFVLFVAALGWLFDCMDQQLFILARSAVMESLIPNTAGLADQDLSNLRLQYVDISTSIFLLGWAIGGLVFGVLGDRWGRAKVMMITILMYSLFTGLSAFAVGVWDFAFYRFLTGLGVGGEFAVGVALVAEVMPNKARPYTLGLLQALSAVGNMTAAMINLGLGSMAESLDYSPWRIMFLVGAVPALLVVVIRRNLKEPENWQKAKASRSTNEKLGSYRELFSTPQLRKHALLGLLLACSGVIGLWSIGFYTPDLIRHVQRPQIQEQVYTASLNETLKSQGALRATLATEAGTDSSTDAQQTDTELNERVRALESLIHAVKNRGERHELSPLAQQVAQEHDRRVTGQLTRWASYSSLAINCGAFLGMFGFGALSQKIGRKPTFAIALISAFVATVSVFLFLQEFWQIWVMVPIMGFCQLSLFAGYAIYFPELFPTRLRSTGTSFCYNVGRLVAAAGPVIMIQLRQFFHHQFPDESFRYAGATMSVVFLVGLLALPFLPETKGQSLPE